MQTGTMTHEKIVEELNEVLQVDIDAVGAYEMAIRSCESEDIKLQMRSFQRDHERHIQELEPLVRRYGGEPKHHADLKGLLQKGMTRLAGAIGDESCLKAMLSNEKTTNSAYAKHVAKPFPGDALDVLRRGLGDEQRHYAWIEAALQQRIWERTQQPTVP